MRNLFLSFLLIISGIYSASAQWIHLDDSLLLGNSITGLTENGSNIFAATADGVYFSTKKDIKWVHASPFYTSVNNICSIDNSLFICLNYAVIMHSEDGGHNWDTLNIPSGKLRALSLFALGKRLVIFDSYAVNYSDDKGKTWKTSSISTLSPRIFYFNNNYILTKEEINNSTLFEISLDGESYDTLKLCSGTNFLIPSQISFTDSALTYVLNTEIENYSITKKKTSLLGFSPSLELKSDQDTTYSVVCLSRTGNRCYIGYREYVPASNTCFAKIYMSNDNCKTWQLVTELPVSSNFMVFSCRGWLIVDNQYKINTIDNTVSHIPKSIEQSFAFVQKSDSSIFSYEPLNTSINISTGNHVTLTPANPANAFLTYYAQLPLDFDDENAVHDRLINGSNETISEDNGKSWKALLIPQLSGEKPKLLGYTKNDILMAAGDSLFHSSDAGNSWHLIYSPPRVASFFNGTFPTAIAVSGKNYYIVAKDTGSDSSFITLAGTVTDSFKAFGDVLRLHVNEVPLEIWFTADSTPIMTTVKRYNGFSNSVFYNTYRLDKIDWNWQLISANDPSKRKLESQLVRAKDKLFSFIPNDGMYYSSDYGASFVKDNSFPDYLTFNNFYAKARLPRIGNTIYVSTNAGMWYNSTFLAPKAKMPDIPPLSFKVFPNPAILEFNINLYASEDQDIVMDLLDVTGRLCSTYSRKAAKGDNTFTISRNGLRKGVYIIRVKTGADIKTQKLVLE